MSAIDRGRQQSDWTIPGEVAVGQHDLYIADLFTISRAAAPAAT
jgi:hypothetical protein